MQLNQIEFGETGRFSALFLDYIMERPSLQPFYGQFPHIGNFQEAIENRSFEKAKRQILTEALKQQYTGVDMPKAVSDNIGLLAGTNTFTITTGHQLNLCTGPLYFIYKIVAAINMAKALQIQYPRYHFVPVYWMATEDHDFQEINHFRLFGKKQEWQTDQAGPVGRMSTESLKPLLGSIPDLPGFMKTFYLQGKNLADAIRNIVNHLFGDSGLVIVDGDDQSLKKQFVPIMHDDLEHHRAYTLATSATTSLEALGYKGQVFPREINLFYMENGLRERIQQSGDQFSVLNTPHTFSQQDLKNLVSTSPEKFSPNVILRPLYQETILPNLAYIGGPAEMAYWLQLKRVFDHYTLPFPMLVPRLFAMVFTKPLIKKMEKLGLSESDVFQSFAMLKERILRQGGEAPPDLEEEMKALGRLFESIKVKAGVADKTLEPFVMAEYKNAEKSVEHIARRIKKAEEQKHETAINQLQSVLDKLFPEGNLQEREDNFLNFYLNNPRFIEEFVELLNPFDFRFNILKEDAQA